MVIYARKFSTHTTISVDSWPISQLRMGWCIRSGSGEGLKKQVPPDAAQQLLARAFIRILIHQHHSLLLNGKTHMLWRFFAAVVALRVSCTTRSPSLYQINYISWNIFLRRLVFLVLREVSRTACGWIKRFSFIKRTRSLGTFDRHSSHCLESESARFTFLCVSVRLTRNHSTHSCLSSFANANSILTRERSVE